MSPQKIVLFCFVLLCSTLLCEAGKGQKVLSVESDPCNQWPNCTSCLSNKYCGWCSTPVKYYDNSPGFQCAGFNPDNSSDPFICYGTYSTDKCAVGYNCSDTEQQCILAQPGDGVPEDQCSSSCYPKTFSCSPTNVSCVPTPASQGGIPLTVCQAQCAANNNTPTDVIGIWRGLQISSEYTSGEWKLLVTTSNASLYYPSGNLYYSGSVSTVQSYLVITITSGSLAGKKVYAFYQTQIGPVTTFLTIATNNPNKGDFSPPVSFDSAMTGGEEFIFEACLDARYCNFDVSTLRERYSKIKDVQDPPVDHCSVFANCSSCLDSPFCGWCSSRVIYQGNVLGANCAGFNQNQTDNPFECVGTYSTQKCPVPPPIYKCDSNTSQCVLSHTGGSSLSVCNATCGRNNSQIFYKCNVATLTCEADQSGQDQETCNSTCQIRPMPVELNGVWRGIEVSENYLKGEWGMVVSSFDNFDSNFTLTSPNNITLYGSFQHVASEAVLIVQFTYPATATRYALYELADGPETSYLTLAFGAFGSDTYPSFIEAMTGEGMSELTFMSCLNPTICKFIPLDLDL